MSSHSNDGNKYINLLQNFSIPLILGVIVALIFANVNRELYDKLVHHTYAFFIDTHDEGHDSHDEKDHDHKNDKSHDGDDAHTEKTKKVSVASAKSEKSDDEKTKDGEAHGKGKNHGPAWLHYFTMHFLVNDIFMVFFFGIAAKEITEACLPNGALNPPKKAINPLMGTIGGVVGPVVVYFILNFLMGAEDGSWTKGWGIPTATDIALAWLVARVVFGPGHPAISFLLLLAVADDGIGLLIIAFAYPDPNHATEWIWLLLLIPAMSVAGMLRWANVRSWVPYIVFGGTLSWLALKLTHMHPALALVVIVPFLPAGESDQGLFKEEAGPVEDNPLDRFEHDLKLIVDFGLFFFAFANAGVAFSNINNLTWIVLLSLLIGKTIGITAFSYGAKMCGIPLPEGMSLKHLVVAGVIAGLGLTVALFVTSQAFTDSANQGAAKMGALFSASAAVIAIILGRALGLKGNKSGATSAESPDE